MTGRTAKLGRAHTLPAASGALSASVRWVAHRLQSLLKNMFVNQTSVWWTGDQLLTTLDPGPVMALAAHDARPPRRFP
jgi:hypothetical protein